MVRKLGIGVLCILSGERGRGCGVRDACGRRWETETVREDGCAKSGGRTNVRGFSYERCVLLYYDGE